MATFQCQGLVNFNQCINNIKNLNLLIYHPNIKTDQTTFFPWLAQSSSLFIRKWSVATNNDSWVKCKSLSRRYVIKPSVGDRANKYPIVNPRSISKEFQQDVWPLLGSLAISWMNLKTDLTRAKPVWRGYQNLYPGGPIKRSFITNIIYTYFFRIWFIFLSLLVTLLFQVYISKVND